MLKDEAIAFIERQMLAIDEVRNKPRFSSEYKKWRRDTKVVITKLFGEDSQHLVDFTAIRFSLNVISGSTPDYKFDEAFIRGLDGALACLDSMRQEIQDFWVDEEVTGLEFNAISIVELICNKFHTVARQMRSRYGDRSTIEVEDEYDVQDLMHALMKIHFDDVRPEEWTPSYAGKSARVDFLLKDELIIVEVKKTRKGLGPKEVGDQLIIDIKRYQSHPDCKCLICFVYDPDGRIGNPASIVNDLSGEHDGLKVLVVIAPKT